MKKMKILSMVLAAIIGCASVPVTPQLAESFSLIAAAAETVSSGTCCENVTWTLDSEGTLTISGTGAMASYERSDESPFYNNANIKSAIIEDGVTSIGSYAFENCESLTSITISDSVTSIGFFAFYYCENLTSITIPDSVTYLGAGAFGYSGLTSINLPNSITIIYNHTFEFCTNLKSINIPNTVIGIELEAFRDCASLEEITLPESVEKIGMGAFFGCKGSPSITILNPDCVIYDELFTICSGYSEEMKNYYFNGTIYGYANSTAQAYAEKYGYNFKVLNASALGDVNNDSNLDSSDAAMILQHYAVFQSDGVGKFTEAQLAVADYNNDKSIDSSDAAMILKAYAEAQSQPK